MILLIDNYDSFVFNLRRYLIQLGQEVKVLRHDACELSGDLTKRFTAIVLSPGPKTPQRAGRCLEIVRRYSGSLPIFGVCLGHQVIYEAFGGVVGCGLRPVHGKVSTMRLLPSQLWEGVPEATAFARYHSLVGLQDTLPDCLQVTAWSPEGEVMAVQHRSHSTFGVQFHPESILSLAGHQVLRNFLRCANLPGVAALPPLDLRNSSEATLCQPARDEEPAVVLPAHQRQKFGMLSR